MHHRTVAEIPPRDAVRAARDLPSREIVRLLAETTGHSGTAVPVVDDLDRPMGVVSEADPLRKAAADADRSSPVPVVHPQEWERAETEGGRAEEVMSAPAVCARPEWTAAEAARLMTAHGVKRPPVVDEADRLRGIVGRGDLLRVHLRRDDAVRDEIVADRPDG
ncbi:hypothetical protein GCM10023347_44460 [Streptomyces chumphonensis]|uniref:CBS domain-containing protein n=1 Tax=Streptomyces chumphonensis TaxID=1214925 RepID=A0A927IAS3_9ACTN|nr:CBS domain-containing protein [Streptomyces chumphonensis]